MNNEAKPKVNPARVFFSILYLALAAAIILFWYEEMFYLDPSSNSFNLPRFFWCFACSCFGFSVLVFRIRYHPKSPFPSYLTYYFFLLIVISALVFSACHLFDKTSGFVFYYISFPFCFILSYLMDSFWNIITSLIKTKTS